MEQNTIHEKAYSFYLVNIDCIRTSEHFNVVMNLEENIESLLPYLAATFQGCTYVHGTAVINWMDRGHIVAIYPRQITITDVKGTEEATDLCREYFKRILEIKTTKDTITPVLQKRSTLTVLDIFRALPQTNCGICQSPTCMAFAARVFRREARIDKCEPLMQEMESPEKLIQDLQSNGYETP